jgi:hypothetical protein
VPAAVSQIIKAKNLFMPQVARLAS